MTQGCHQSLLQAQMREGGIRRGAQGKEARALGIRLSRARPGPFTTDHMLPWHPNTSLTTTQPFPTLVLCSQTAPNTPPFSQLATQTWQGARRPPVPVNDAPREKGCELQNSSHSCTAPPTLPALDWQSAKITPLKGIQPGTAAQGAGGVPIPGGM